MAAGSERSPPPFPDSEEQDPEPELGEDEDSDEGADIFTGSVSKPHWCVLHELNTETCVSAKWLS